MSITEEGRKQAAAVTDHFNLVVCSPLKRARETLDASNITYDKLEIVDLARERRLYKSDFFEGEDFETLEPAADFVERMEKLKELLRGYCGEHDRVLVICHWWVAKFITSTNQQEIISGESRLGNGLRLENCEMTTLEL